MKEIFTLNYTRRIWSWLWQGKYYILSILVIFLTVLYIIGLLNFYPDIVSFFMTIVGIFILFIRQILDTREFSYQNPNTLRNWIMSFPTKRTVTIDVLDTLLTSDSVKAHVTVSISENATIENKVEFLLRQVISIQDSISNLDKRIDNVKSSITKEIKELTTNVHNLDTSLKTIVARHAVGTYDMNFFGIIIILCGTVIQYFSTQRI
jgi:hypothetical protein